MNPLPSMNPRERARLLAAASRAYRAYPGPVGKLISRELEAWQEFGYRLGSKTLIMALVEDVIDAPVERADAA